MSTPTTGSITDNSTAVTHLKKKSETLAFVQISGTYAGITFKIQGTRDSNNWFDIAAIRYDTGGLVTGAISPTDDSEMMWKVPSEGLAGVRVKPSAYTSGTGDIDISSDSFIGLPFAISGTVTNLQTLSMSMGTICSYIRAADSVRIVPVASALMP